MLEEAPIWAFEGRTSLGLGFIASSSSLYLLVCLQVSRIRRVELLVGVAYVKAMIQLKTQLMDQTGIKCLRKCGDGFQHLDSLVKALQTALTCGLSRFGHRV